MVYDPNSVIPHAHEVRVTMRGVRITPDGAPVQVSTRSDFIAPELSAPSTLAIELDKGLRGWSDYDKKIPSNDPVFTDWAKRDLAQATVGTTVIRHTAPTAGMAVRHRTGPRPGRKA